ncbi:MAG TPA: hypothetical protein VF584_10065 [Longimicrobium sp.]|jgi:hypothetical protein
MQSIRHTIFASAVAVAALAAAAPAAAQNGPCRDPWVSRAIREVTAEMRRGREANGRHESGECNIHLYGGRWSSYGELKGYVSAVLRRLDNYEARFTADGTFYMDDDYGNIEASADKVRIVSPSGTTDGAGNRAPDNGSQFSGAIGLGNGVSIRFSRP